MDTDRERVAAALPGYDIGLEIGAGGFGRVLEGRHRGLRRKVAIKVLPAVAHAGTGAGGEARILASLVHPHIVQVYDYVEEDGLSLIVMERLANATLTERCASLGAQGACAVGLAVAAALTCAHGKNVLHRDIKPDNIMFDDAGMLKVVDFGIAKLVDEFPAAVSGRIGTPRFMAPEQVAGGRLSPAVDVYAVGKVLYLLLGGAEPEASDPCPAERSPAGTARFGALAISGRPLGLSPAEPAVPGVPSAAVPLPRRVRGANPPPGPVFDHRAGLPPDVPPAIADVVLTALARDPAARFSSARELALALAHAGADTFGAGWTARSGIRLQLDDDLRAAADRPAADRGRAASRPPAPPFPGTINPGSSTAAPQRPAPGQPQTTPDPSDPAPASTGDGDDPAARPRERRSRNTRRRIRRRLLAVAVVAAALMFTGLSIVAATRRGGTDTADAAHQLGAPLAGHTNWVTSLAFAPDRRTLASGSRDGTVRLWQVSDPEHARQIGSTLPRTDGVVSVAFSADSGLLASGNWDGTVRLWDVRDPAHPRPTGAALPASTAPVTFVAFDGSGQVLTDGARDGTTRLWAIGDLASPRLLSSLSVSHGAVDWTPQATDPVGAILVGAGVDGDDRRIGLWGTYDPSTPRSLHEFVTRHSGPVYGVAITQDQRTLATAGKDTTVELWDLTDLASPHPLGSPLTGHSNSVWTVAFSPDGRLLASGSFDRTVRLWDLSDRTRPRQLGKPLAGPTDFVQAVAFSPDGAVLATGGWDRTIRLWHVPTPSAGGR